MIFKLSDSLMDEILFAMENQTQEFCVDAEKNSVRPVEEAGVIDEENFYELPSWNSSDGFSLREDFVNKLHSPFARADLKRVLAGGRGVFRNFKKVLKEYPEVEKQWIFFKNKAMSLCITKWYNSLCESWGLEKQELQEDETQELVESDFVFSPYDPQKDDRDISLGKDYLSDGIKEQYGGSLGEAVDYLFRRQTEFPGEISGFVCRSQDDDFAGCILYSECPFNIEKSAALTDYFIIEKYSGLGIGRELLLKCAGCLKKGGFRWIIVSNILLPEGLKFLLEQSGFKKIGSGFAADLNFF